MWALIIFILFFGSLLIVNIYVINNKPKYRDIKKKTWKDKTNDK